MAGKTYSFCDGLLTAFRGTQLPAITANTFVALMTTNPTVDDMTSAVETTYTNYARPSIASSTSGWGAPASGTGTTRQITNSLALNFGTAGSGPVTITGFALCQHVATALANAECYYWNVLTGGNQVINNGNPVTAAIGALVLNED